MIVHASTLGMDGIRPRSGRRSASVLKGDTAGWAEIGSYTATKTSTTDGGFNYDVYSLAHNQTIEIVAPGTIEFLVVGAGAGGGNGTIGAGGGGGGIIFGTMYVGAGTYTASIGTGGPNGEPNGGSGNTSIGFGSGISAGPAPSHGTYSDGPGGMPVSVPNISTVFSQQGGTGKVGAQGYGVPGQGGITSTITGTLLGYGGGGGGGAWDGPGGAGSNGGGNGGGSGHGARGGGGGGGSWNGNQPGGVGSNGVVIVRTRV